MSINAQCDICRHQWPVDRSELRSSGRCPLCQSEVVLREAEPEPDPADADKPTAWERTQKYARNTFSAVAVVLLLGFMISLLWFDPRKPFGTLVAAASAKEEETRSFSGVRQSRPPQIGRATTNPPSAIPPRSSGNAPPPSNKGNANLNQQHDEIRLQHLERIERQRQAIEQARARQKSSSQDSGSGFFSDDGQPTSNGTSQSTARQDGTQTNAESGSKTSPGNPFRRLSSGEDANANDPEEMNDAEENKQPANPFRRIPENTDDQPKTDRNPFKKSTSNNNETSIHRNVVLNAKGDKKSTALPRPKSPRDRPA